MRPLLALAGVAVLAGVGCKPPAAGDGGSSPDGTAAASDGGGLPKVVTTTTMLTDLVRQVAGDAVEVVPLMPPGVDPHLFSLSARSASTLKTADAVVYSGLHLEGKITESFAAMADQGIPVLALAETVPEGDRIMPEDAGGQPDPHVWGDVAVWAGCIPEVREFLTALAPGQAGAITARAEAYGEELAELDAWAEQEFAKVPAERRVLITSHDAFAYFGRAYEIEVLGLQGISTADEASLAGVAALVDTVKQRGIRAVFPETSVSDGPLRRVAADAGVKLGGALYSDSMSTPGDVVTVDGVSYDRGAYTGMIRHNVNTVVGGLK